MLSLTRVDAAIGTIPILRDISFSVATAQTVALVGRKVRARPRCCAPSWALPDSHGDMRFDGRDMQAVAPHLRPGMGIGYAPEPARVFALHDRREHPAAREVAGLDQAETRCRLDRIHLVLPELRELGPRPAGSVSGGQGKMVALGRALMLSTRLLLLDEPSRASPRCWPTAMPRRLESCARSTRRSPSSSPNPIPICCAALRRARSPSNAARSTATSFTTGCPHEPDPARSATEKTAQGPLGHVAQTPMTFNYQQGLRR